MCAGERASDIAVRPIRTARATYRWLRDEAPVYQGKMSILSGYFLSRYEDCEQLLKDPRFIRNRTTATGGGGRLPFPLPKAIAPMMHSMILEDDPAHRRLRNLVHKAFTPHAIAQLGEQVNTLSHELLDKAELQGHVDLKTAYALPIPVTVIAQMLGVSDHGLPTLTGNMKVLMSKSSVSVATQMLIQFKLIQRVSVPGMRRDYYRVQDGVWNTLMLAQVEEMSNLRKVAEKGLRFLENTDTTQTQRLQEMYDFARFLEQEMPLLVERWRDRTFHHQAKTESK